MLKKNNILFISGPTTSGKSKLALKLAKIINGEIINADSMQVYKELSIITARPSEKDEKIIPHHLYGHISGKNRYNVYKWCNECASKIKKIISNNKVPIITGGTGLYFNAFIKGINKIPSVPEELKKESNLRIKNIGIKNFINELQNLDPESLKKINSNDLQRLKRLWEVVAYTGKGLSEWKKSSKKNFLNQYDYNFILMSPEKKILYDNCEKRFLKMIKNGALNEVKNLRIKNFDLGLPIMKAHGVPELINVISGKQKLNEAIEQAQLSTKRYVKRQVTWWKSSSIKIDIVFKKFPSNNDLISLEILKKLTN